MFEIVDLIGGTAVLMGLCTVGAGPVTAPLSLLCSCGFDVQ
jgi:hypothetical protein